MAEQKSFLYLSAATLDSLGITTEQIITRLEKLISDSTANKVWAAPKAAISTEDGRYMMATLSAADDPQLLAVKSVIVNPRNPARGLASINGTVMLLDSDTGLPVAIIDGNWITAIRTACASAIAAKRLAKSDASSIAFIGCGVQAQSHLNVLSDLFPIAEMHAFGRGEKNRDALCDSARSMGLAATASSSARDAVKNADIVVTSVSISFSGEPFVDANWLKPGAFAAITDLALPWMPESMPVFDNIIIDDLAQEAAMPTPMVETRLIKGDISGLVENKINGRRTPDERNAFVFRAIALGDLALAGLAYEVAKEKSLGSEIGTT